MDRNRAIKFLIALPAGVRGVISVFKATVRDLDEQERLIATLARPKVSVSSISVDPLRK